MNLIFTALIQECLKKDFDISKGFWALSIPKNSVTLIQMKFLVNFDTLLFYLQWLELALWNVDAKIAVKIVEHHLTDSILMKRYSHCQVLAYCVLPQVTCLVKTKCPWNLLLVPLPLTVEMQEWENSCEVLWDLQEKKRKSVKVLLLV